MEELIKYKWLPGGAGRARGRAAGPPGRPRRRGGRRTALEGGERPKAFVFAAQQIDPGAMMAWVAERFAPCEKIREVEFVGEIRRSAAGKILRRLLRK
ncbi:hypothetical protein GCM10010464_27800 [Pseudonocardia yunnanensis]|uniref:AMP-binding enzyme C-terminal domain-containing protein n=1 Tax=Pseudonocardia yunnanensis TaxID=58107 RepID=A0ABW4F304_9PSEU